MISFPLEIHLEVWLLDHTVVNISNFLRNTYIVSSSGYANVHSYQQCMRAPFSPHPHWHLPLVFFNDSHYNRCEVIPHCDFDLHFRWFVMLNTFSCISWLFVCHLSRKVYSSPLPFFNWIVCIFVTEMRVSYILDIYFIHQINGLQVFLLLQMKRLPFAFWLFTLVCRSFLIWCLTCLFLLLLMCFWCHM